MRSSKPLNITEIAQIGEDLYDRDLRDRLETTDLGRFVVIDVTSGDYEVGDDDLVASLSLEARRPNAMTWGVRIGSDVAYRIGFQVGEPGD